ncbi:peroxidase family protein [Salinisphaera aquimarina]|uniref:Heme peroxidase family protein n=1 Tax=Salinisphaera aquimarina TaxID=2094031 RepID=A0ABV7ET80_9GAMM
MFTKINHIDGVTGDDEILFSTPFDYFFPEAARSRLCRLPETEATVAGLKRLGDLMADPGEIGDPQESFDSTIPAAFTYFGQFTDHDITARTDREGAVSEIGRAEPVRPADPDFVVANMRNGRRPQFDLDSVFGDGPGLAGASAAATTQSQLLYDSDLKLVAFADGDRVDLPREAGTHNAIIADARNDENVIIGQLQTAFLRFYNAAHDAQPGSDNKQKYIRARQLVRWAYQYVVVNDYLKQVCDPAVVDDTLANGPRFIGATSGKGAAFMPLEFSAAAYRFAHSMIRPFYRLNATSGEVGIGDLLGPAGRATNFDASDGQLIPARVVDWSLLVGSGSGVQMARKIDSKISRGLFTLPVGGRATDPVLRHLARSNLLRGYSLSLPTGQAICDAFGILPLSTADIKDGESPEMVEMLEDTYFDHRTPLWYYILREAAVQQDGNRLGEVGSRLVAETMVGLVKQDHNSYLNNLHDDAIDIELGVTLDESSAAVGGLAGLLDFAGVSNVCS